MGNHDEHAGNILSTLQMCLLAAPQWWLSPTLDCNYGIHSHHRWWWPSIFSSGLDKLMGDWAFNGYKSDSLVATSTIAINCWRAGLEICHYLSSPLLTSFLKSMWLASVGRQKWDLVSSWSLAAGLLLLFFCPDHCIGSCEKHNTAAKWTRAGTHHNWKLATWVESQKSMPITTLTVSPGARDSASTRKRARERA